MYARAELRGAGRRPHHDRRGVRHVGGEHVRLALGVPSGDRDDGRGDRTDHSGAAASQPHGEGWFLPLQAKR